MTDSRSVQPRKLPRQTRSRQTVDRLLDAADRLLAREGLLAFNTNAIAAEAGIDIASLYQYFPGKESIAYALLERRCLALQARCELWRFEAVSTPLSQLLEQLLLALYPPDGSAWSFPELEPLIASVPELRELTEGLLDDLASLWAEILLARGSLWPLPQLKDFCRLFMVMLLAGALYSTRHEHQDILREWLRDASLAMLRIALPDAGRAR
jgi:AcrR family transcriptional regulator